MANCLCCGGDITVNLVILNYEALVSGEGDGAVYFCACLSIKEAQQPRQLSELGKCYSKFMDSLKESSVVKRSLQSQHEPLKQVWLSYFVTKSF
ncbi:unnamed protein product [Urochloa humidicola]